MAAGPVPSTAGTAEGMAAPDVPGVRDGSRQGVPLAAGLHLHAGAGFRIIGTREKIGHHHGTGQQDCMRPDETSDVVRESSDRRVFRRLILALEPSVSVNVISVDAHKEDRLSAEEFQSMLCLLRRFADTEMDQFALWRLGSGEDEPVYVSVGLKPVGAAESSFARFETPDVGR